MKKLISVLGTLAAKLVAGGNIHTLNGHIVDAFNTWQTVYNFLSRYLPAADAAAIMQQVAAQQQPAEDSDPVPPPTVVSA